MAFGKLLIFSSSLLLFSVKSFAAETSSVWSSFAAKVDFLQQEAAITRASVGPRFNEHLALLVGVGIIDTQKAVPNSSRPTWDQASASQYALTALTSTGGIFGASGYRNVIEVQIGSYVYKDYVQEGTGKAENTYFLGGSFKLASPNTSLVEGKQVHTSSFQFGITYELRFISGRSQVKNIGMTPLRPLSIGPEITFEL